ncbi:MAG: alpha/beta fold hydrolase [Pseudomonadota bacterium]
MATVSETLEELTEKVEGAAFSAAMSTDSQKLMKSLNMIMQEAISEPRAVANASSEMLQEMAKVLAGSSELEPDEWDVRFRDESWRENPVYKRLGQGYLAWSNALDSWLDNSNLEGINRQRAEFILRVIKEAGAPPNTLLGNPEALKKAWESRGGTLLKGARRFINDWRQNNGFPAAAERDHFKVGVDVAITKGSVIFRDKLMEVIHYVPTTDKVHEVPFLYVFSQVNRYYLGDLTPERSLMKELLDEGFQVFTISWKNPTRENRDWDAGTYADGVIRTIDIIREITGAPKVNMMGLCAGGLSTTLAAGVLQQRGIDTVNSMSLVVNILDFQPEDSDFGLFVSASTVRATRARMRIQGLMTERDVAQMFSWLRPEENIFAFLRNNYLLGGNLIKHPLLVWSMDNVRLPAGLFEDFTGLSYDNKLAQGEFEVLGERIDLSQVKYDVYLASGVTDHITPWKGGYRSTQLFGGDIEFVLSNQGHTALISSKITDPKLKYWRSETLPETSEEWMKVAEEHQGEWRKHWIDWLKPRSGKMIAAPKQVGNDKYRRLMAAPGGYVLE